jgi:superfamily II DNA or RNA helicase
VSPYFEDHYGAVRYPVGGDWEQGLRNAQVGTIHAVAAHFTIRRKEPAIVVMPTGSGKSAVLMMTAFVERARTALVVTPGLLVRGQIAEGFRTLSVLKRAGVVDGSTPEPRVAEVKKRIMSSEGWEALRDYDVVVGTPSSISPTLDDVPAPPEDLFDLLLIDEAHHSPAVTWNGLLSSFPEAKRVLFTATPFRRDRREIEGRFVYSYPVRDAYEDGNSATSSTYPSKLPRVPPRT